MEQGSHAAEIDYHVNWPSHDRWNLADTVDAAQRRDYYGVDGIPWLDIDGNDSCSQIGVVIRAWMARREEIPSHIWLSVRAWARSDGDSAMMEVKAVADSAFAVRTRLYMAMTSIYDSLRTPDGRSDIYSAMYKMYPDGDGQPFVHSGNTTDTVVFRATFAMRYTGDVPMHFDNLKFVAWVQDDTTREVMQAGSGLPSRIISPSPGDTLWAGYWATFRWVPVSRGDSVTIELNRNYPGGTWERIQSNLPDTVVSQWPVRGDLSDHARFRIWQMGDSTVCDTSPGDLYIMDPNGAAARPSVVHTYEVSEAYPNPFNPNTTISFTLPKAGRVRMTVYDVLGRRVATLFDASLEAGAHRQFINASSWATGVYFVKIAAGEHVAVRKLMLLK